MLKNYGDFISEDEFNSFIPKQIKEYESTYPYTESYDGDLSTLIEEQPIQLANGNIYHGHWNNQNYKMEGPGELFLRKDSVYVKGFWKEFIFLIKVYSILNRMKKFINFVVSNSSKQ